MNDLQFNPKDFRVKQANTNDPLNILSDLEKAAWYSKATASVDPISYHVRWLYVINGSDPPRIYARVVTDIHRFNEEVGALHLSGAYVRQVHEDMVSDPTVVLSPVLVTPFKVMVGSEVVFELNDPEWIVKATANVLTDVGNNVTSDAYSKTMLSQQFIMLKSRRAGATNMYIEKMRKEDMDDQLKAPTGFFMKGQPDKSAPYSAIRDMKMYIDLNNKIDSDKAASIIQTPKVESLKDKIIKHLNRKNK